jgi:serine/threonine protein kinase
MNEKTIQMSCNSPFIVKMHETFNEYDSLLCLNELLLGGELRTAYVRNGLFGSTAHCQYYVASAVYALEHMQERDVIFRDLKPENMLLSATGRMKVTDFGLAKVSAGKSYTQCGSFGSQSWDPPASPFVVFPTG